MTTVIECGACWAKAVQQVRPHRGAILFHTYRLMLAEHDRAADRGQEDEGHQ